jgi:hypothetical protein
MFPSFLDASNDIFDRRNLQLFFMATNNSSKVASVDLHRNKHSNFDPPLLPSTPHPKSSNILFPRVRPILRRHSPAPLSFEGQNPWAQSAN